MGRVRVLRSSDGKFAGSVGQGHQGVFRVPIVPRAVLSSDSPSADGLSEDSKLAETIAVYESSRSKVVLRDVNGTEREFLAGDIEQARWHLMNGNCHSLAAALHLRTGLPLLVFWSVDSDRDEDSHITHVAVRVGPDEMLDALGVSSISSFESCELVEVHDITQGIEGLTETLDWDSRENQRTWLRLDPGQVESFANRLIDEAGLKKLSDS